ncbi:MAG: hypothetical protein ACKVS9_02660 [Phycisphaerae bacterium]
MSESAQKINPQLRAGFDYIRRDFHSLREERFPIRAVLIHEATNASHYGVQPYPYESEFGFCGKVCAGMREGGVVTDVNGMPLFADEPELDAHGKPIVNSAGEAFVYVVPAMRTVAFFGDTGAVSRLRRVSTRAATLIAQIPVPACAPPAGWRFSPGSGGLWWATLFEYAWTGAHPLLKASRYICHPAERQGSIQLPYDRDELKRQLEGRVFAELFALVPREWVNRLPDAYASHLDDAATACCDFLEILVGTTEADSNQKQDTGMLTSGSVRREDSSQTQTSKTPRPASGNEKWRSLRKRMLKLLRCDDLPGSIRTTANKLDSPYSTVLAAVHRSPILAAHFKITPNRVPNFLAALNEDLSDDAGGTLKLLGDMGGNAA